MMNNINKMGKFYIIGAVVSSIFPFGAANASCDIGPDPCDTDALAMVRNYGGFSADPLFTVGESIKGYMPPGIPDGIAAFRKNASIVKVLVNHHVGRDQGETYQLANGTQLRGARVSAFNVRIADRKLDSATIGFASVRDRTGADVTSASQINETGDSLAGFDQLSASAGYNLNTFGFVNALAFVSEETSESAGHPHGGSVWAIDVTQEQIWALPALGRGAWEKVVALAPPNAGTIALAMSDGYGGPSRLPGGSTFNGAPLYIYIGTKSPVSATFPERNGLTTGQLYYYKAATACDAPPALSSPQDFNGTGAVMSGVLCAIAVRDQGSAGEDGYDADGWLNAETLRATALANGAFAFSRPAGVSTDPKQPTRFAYTSAGRGSVFPADDWGDLYEVNTNLGEMTASVRIIYDGDDSGGGKVVNSDYGVRSPDNVLWGKGGLLYVSEDPATELHTFGAVSRKPPGTWRVNPQKGGILHIMAVDVRFIAPSDATNMPRFKWENAGMVDVATLFRTSNLFMVNVQAHGIKNGSVAGNNLIEGGQLLFLTYTPK